MFPLQLSKPWRVLETVDHVPDDLDAVCVFGGAAYFPSLDGVHRGALALCGWSWEPACLPSNYHLDIRFRSVDIRFHRLNVVVLIEEQVRNPVVPFLERREVPNVA